MVETIAFVGTYVRESNHSRVSDRWGRILSIHSSFGLNKPANKC